MANDNSNLPEAAAAGAILSINQRLDQLDELLTDQEKAIRAAFRDFVVSVQSEAAIAAVVERVEARDLEGAMKIVDSYIARMAGVIPRVYQAVGEASVPEMSALAADAASYMPKLLPGPTPILPTQTAPAPMPGPSSPPAPPSAPPPAAPPAVPPEPSVAISFDPSNPRAAELVREHRVQFVTHFSEQQRAATTQAIARAQLEGGHAISTARAIRDSIGLTPDQEQWVANYEASLRNRSRNALQRDLRDRTFDGRVERAIQNNRPLTEKQIGTMVDRYRKNALQMRAQTIALTEGQTAASAARDESLAQMIEQTGLDANAIEETWNATRDLRTRGWHASMNGQKQPLGSPFISGLGNRLMRPGDPNAPAKERINCRCAKTFSVRPAP
jgi:hypothetical protein